MFLKNKDFFYFNKVKYFIQYNLIKIYKNIAILSIN